MCVINHHSLPLDPLIAFILLKKEHPCFTTFGQNEHFQCFHCLKSWSFVADHMFLKSICSVLLLLLREGGNCERVLTFYVGEVVRLILQPPLHWAGAKGSSSFGSTRGEEEEDETPQMLSLGPLYLAARCQEDKLWWLQDHNIKVVSKTGACDITHGEGVMYDARLCSGSTASEITRQYNTKQKNTIIIIQYEVINQTGEITKYLIKPLSNLINKYWGKVAHALTPHWNNYNNFPIQHSVMLC